MDFQNMPDFEEMNKALEAQHEKTKKYWEWIISEGPCVPPLEGIRSAVETLMAMEKEVLNHLKEGRFDLSDRATASAVRLENRAYHLITHNLLQQLLDRSKGPERL